MNYDELNELVTLREQLQAAKALLEKAQADTRRLDWLEARAKKKIVKLGPTVRGDECWVIPDDGNNYFGVTHRAAIDEAMRKT